VGVGEECGCGCVCVNECPLLPRCALVWGDKAGLTSRPDCAYPPLPPPYRPSSTRAIASPLRLRRRAAAIVRAARAGGGFSCVRRRTVDAPPSLALAPRPRGAPPQPRHPRPRRASALACRASNAAHPLRGPPRRRAPLTFPFSPHFFPALCSSVTRSHHGEPAPAEAARRDHPQVRPAQDLVSAKPGGQRRRRRRAALALPGDDCADTTISLLDTISSWLCVVPASCCAVVPVALRVETEAQRARARARVAG
jgi:hypothetical protein